MRRDLPEGFDIAQMAPRLGWGRILLSPRIRERYMSLRIFGRAYFLCRHHSPGVRRWRGWVHRESQ